jgi:hypothetical protein
MHLACIGDNKALLDAYAGYDTSTDWTTATTTLAGADDIPVPSVALKALTKYIDYHVNLHGNNKKRKKLCDAELEPPINYKFDFDRFQREHPHPLAINEHAISHQIINTRFIKYEELDLSHRINLVKSEMMTGKTSNLIIKELQSLPPNVRVIALTPKCLFAESLRGVFRANGFEFAHYKDADFYKKSHDRVIIEVESLWKIKMYNIPPYDYLLIDESETTISQMLCTATHRHNIKNNWLVLLWLLENASKVLLTDARLSMISLGFILDHCARHEIHFIRNVFQIPMQVNLYLDKKAMEKQVVDAVERHESIYTFSGSRTHAYHLHGKTKKAFGEDKSVIYSSLNSKTERVKADLSNVNESWRQKLAVHTSPSITIGTSFDVEDVISHVFLFPITQTAGPKDVAQASRRIRKPIIPVLNVAITGQSKDVPTTHYKIKQLLDRKSELMLDMEKERVAKDYVDDAERLQLVRALINTPHEKSTLIKTGIRAIQERNLQLKNYQEELTRIFLDCGHSIQIIRGSARADECIKPGMAPEEKVFLQYEGTCGIMTQYEENEEDLHHKERTDTLSEDEDSLLRMVQYIKNFDPSKWPLLSYEYWLDYRYKLAKDKRLQMLMTGTLEGAQDALDRHHRFQVANAEGGQDTTENTGLLHTSIIPEVSSVNFHAFAKPLFRIFELLDLRDGLTTDSIMIKMKSQPIGDCLRDCRVLLGPSGWGDRDLPRDPTFQQTIRFLTDMMYVLVDGNLTVTSMKRIAMATDTKVETTDNRRKSGKTTQRKREKVMDYELKFYPPPNPKSQPYNALERFTHLVPIVGTAVDTDD